MQTNKTRVYTRDRSRASAIVKAYTSIDGFINDLIKSLEKTSLKNEL
jgi:hypothetical protein